MGRKKSKYIEKANESEASLLGLWMSAVSISFPAWYDHGFFSL